MEVIIRWAVVNYLLTSCPVWRGTLPIKKVDRPNDVWEVDLTYIHCGIDGWGYLFNVFDIFARVWVGYCFDLSAVKENAIISIENALVSHKEIEHDNNNKPTIRADNGSQYTSNAFRKSMSVLGIKLEHIACDTPEQNGHIESFHKTLHKIGEGFTIGVLLMFSLGNKNRHILATGAIAGIPTMLGAAMGYALIPPTVATYFFAAAVGATISVITIAVHVLLTTASRSNLLLIGILAGFLFMFLSGVLHLFE